MDLTSTIDPNHTEILALNEEFEANWNKVRKYYSEEEIIDEELAHVESTIEFLIDYSTDLENPYHQAFEHFPSVPQVLETKTDDCDGMAIVACSILIHRGYDCYVIMNERHAWAILLG